jgi:hypothetical protein
LQFDSATEYSFCLNFINEYDLVARVDIPYMLSLVNLYRSIYHLPPIEEADSEKGSKSNAQENYIHQTGAGQDVNKEYWTLPEPYYHHIGERVVLRLSISGGENDEGSEEGREEQLMLSAFQVHAEDFAKLLFCRVPVHAREYYGERVGLITKGRFNGRNYWVQESSCGLEAAP